MNIQDAASAQQLLGSGPSRRPENPEEAARQFEEVLVRQFVETMTEGLFDAGLSGDDSPGWMGAYGDMQKDTLSDVLTEHLVDSGTLRLRDMLLRQWGQHGAAQEAEVPADEPVPLPGDPSLHLG